MIYWIAKEVFHIKDMIFNNEEARTGLWNFVAAHFSMINHVEGDTYTDEPLAFLLEDASIKEVISPYYMGRIVDFVSFIEKYPFKPSVLDREWKFRLVDPIMECIRKFPSDNLKGWSWTGYADHGAMRRYDQYSDNDHYADGLQTPGISCKDWTYSGSRVDD